MYLIMLLKKNIQQNSSKRSVCVCVCDSYLRICHYFRIGFADHIRIIKILGKHSGGIYVCCPSSLRISKTNHQDKIQEQLKDLQYFSSLEMRCIFLVLLGSNDVY
jgi:hypothetical protein